MMASYKPSTTTNPTMPDHGYMELIWENGQIVMQSISNRASIPSASTKAPEEGLILMGKGLLQTTLPSEQTKMNNQQHEMNPRLDYPFDDIYMELFPEVSGHDLDCLSLTTVPADEATNLYSQMVRGRDTHAAQNPSTSKVSERCLEGQEFLFRQQCQPFMSSSRSKRSDIMTIGAFNQCGIGDLPIKMKAQGPTSSKHPRSSAPLMNVSHFPRLPAQVDSNFQFMVMRSNSETEYTPAGRSSMEPNSVNSDNEMRKVFALCGQMPSGKSKEDLNLPAQHAKREVSFQNSEPFFWEDDSRDTSKHNGNTNSATNLRLPDNVSCHGSSFQGHSVAGKNQSEKPNEPVNISPSMCSANVGPGASPNDIKNKAKWKTQEREASEYKAEDSEDDSAGTRKPTTRKSTSIKRSRGVGLHSFSERRRRYRINEKIRALRRLIPNCTKVDKASTLDEAIKYLKTLQMQVQIMSMYSGLHMMPVMLSSGTPPPIRPSHPSPFAPMGFNMGMGSGLELGTGMLEMTGPSMVPMPHMQGPLYPYGSIPRTVLLHGMPASTNLHMFGQGSSPMSIPHPTSMTQSSAVSMKVNHTPEMTDQVRDSALPDPKDEQLQTTDPPGGETSSKIGHKSWH